MIKLHRDFSFRISGLRLKSPNGHSRPPFFFRLSGDRIVRGDPKFRRRSSPHSQRRGKSGSAVALALVSRQIASAVGGDSETPAG